MRINRYENDYDQWDVIAIPVFRIKSINLISARNKILSKE